MNPDLSLLEKVINSCQKQVDEIIIVDNNSHQETKIALRAIEKKFLGFANLIWKSEDNGLAASLNSGAQIAIERGAIWILTLDDDSIPANDMVAVMLKSYKSLPKKDQERVGLITPNLTTPKGLGYPDGAPKVCGVGGTTAGQMVKTSILPRVGFWNEGLFIDGVDGEFCCRVWQHGFKTLLVPKAVIYTRPGHPTMKKIFWKTAMVPNYAPYRYYYMVRNFTYLHIRNFRSYVLHNNYWFRALRTLIFPRPLIKMMLFEDNRRKKLRAVRRGFWDGIHGRLGRMPENI